MIKIFLPFITLFERLGSAKGLTSELEDYINRHNPKSGIEVEKLEREYDEKIRNNLYNRFSCYF